MHGFNWFAFISGAVNEHNVHVITAGFVVILLLLAGFVVRSKIQQVEKAIVPSEKGGLSHLFEVVFENILSLAEGIIGHGAKKHIPLIAGLFFFIFFSNLLGLIPGFSAPTSNINTNLACAVCVFLYFNIMGIKEQGLVKYFKHFMGPIWWMAPLILAIELFGIALRPVTLSLRLFCNINADHLVLGIFSELVPIIIPIVFMILGLFIAFIQAFVFTLLTTIYISLATVHEEEHH